jgi:hypothetical protein
MNAGRKCNQVMGGTVAKKSARAKQFLLTQRQQIFHALRALAQAQAARRLASARRVRKSEKIFRARVLRDRLRDAHFLSMRDDAHNLSGKPGVFRFDVSFSPQRRRERGENSVAHCARRKPRRRKSLLALCVSAVNTTFPYAGLLRGGIFNPSSAITCCKSLHTAARVASV